MNAASLPAQQKLREHHGDLPMERGVANVVLARRAMGSLQHEVAGGRVVGGGGFERLHVRSVPRFGHREATRQVEPAGGAQIFPVMRLGAQLLNGAGKKSELHAELDQERQIVVREGLEDGDERARIFAPAVRRRQRQGSKSFAGEAAAPGVDLRPIFGPARLVEISEFGTRQKPAHALAQSVVVPVEQPGEGRAVLLGRQRLRGRAVRICRTEQQPADVDRGQPPGSPRDRTRRERWSPRARAPRPGKAQGRAPRDCAVFAAADPCR